MKKITLLASMAMVAAAASAQYTVDPTTETVLEKGKVSNVMTIVLDAGSVAKFEAQGATVTSAGPNGENQNLWIWDNTFQAGDGSYPGVGDHFDGYVDLVVGTVGWSGAGFNIVAPGISTEWWNDETRFHAAYLATGTAPASIALIIADGEADCGSIPAKIALGTPFVDNGATFPAVAPAANNDWQGLDLSFADLKKLYPTFAPKAISAWTGNMLSFLAGGVQGNTMSLDAVYFYQPASDGVNDVMADAAEWIITDNTINVAGVEGISLYDLSGKLVKAVAGTTMGINNVAGGLYIAKAGNSVRKVVVK